MILVKNHLNAIILIPPLLNLKSEFQLILIPLQKSYGLNEKLFEFEIYKQRMLLNPSKEDAKSKQRGC